MKKQLLPLALIVGFLMIAAPAQADWFVGDDFKMHYPQLPDPFGWDIEIVTSQHEVADDWLCTRTGPVGDIHFWYSVAQGLPTRIDWVTATIYSDVPAGAGQLPYSSPGQPLWTQTFDASQFTVIDPYGTGNQGFADPQLDPAFGWKPNDHFTFQQINIVDIAEPFKQEEGTIYWLGLYVGWEGTQSPVGWKTSLDKFQDDAVYRDLAGGWQELIDPLTGRSLDMAFVITPEPATLALLLLGATTMIRRT